MTKKITKSTLTEDLYNQILDNLKNDYLESFITLKEFSEKYNVSEVVIKYILEKENIKKDRSRWNKARDPLTIQKIKQTKLERYGDENYNNTEKNRENRLKKYNGNYFSEEARYKFSHRSEESIRKTVEKQKKTMIERYGVDNIFKRVDIIQSKMIEKHGVHNPSLLQEVKDKKRLKSQERYGTNCTFQAKEVKEKARQTCIERFGVDNANKSEEVKEKSRQTRLKNGTQRFNGEEVHKFLENWNKKRKPTVSELQQSLDISELSNTFKMLSEEDREYFQLKTSYLEVKVCDFLDENNIIYERRDRKLISPQELDFYIPEFNLAIEINDIYSHNSSKEAYGKPKKDIKYHFNKTQICSEKGIRLIHLYEPYIMNENKWTILKDIILHACKKSKKIYARKLDLEIKSAIEMKSFFEENNIQGYRNAITAFVLVDKITREPFMCYTVGHAFFGKGKYDAEIARGACKLGYSVVGGASRLWKHIIEYYRDKNLYNEEGSINSIVYYVDLNHYSGQSMNFLPNVKFIKNQPGFWNYWREDNTLRNRDPLHHQEIKQLEKEGKVLVIGNSGTQVNVWKRNE